jgi:hypothetical protein
MKSSKNALIWIVLVVVIILGAMWWARNNVGVAANLGEFTQCLKDEGVTYYGAFWCPNCQNQTKLFGKSAKALPYVECSTRDGRDQLPVCTEAGITAYPTWEFADGTRETGVLSLQQLAERTSCELPAEE